jgi:D-sedoheptulose 7-phosphate isomerase
MNKSPTLQDVWQTSFREAQATLALFLEDSKQLEKCARFSEMLIQTYEYGGNVFSCGNGGSHCDAMHFAEEFTGRYRKDRRPLGALALGDASHVTCVANDYGFAEIFSRQVEGLARKGDLLLGLSTSGNSENVIRAFQAARKKGVQTVALLGRDGGKLLSLADLAIVIPAQTSDRIQEMHIKIIHTVIETVERKLFPENY